MKSDIPFLKEKKSLFDSYFRKMRTLSTGDALLLKGALLALAVFLVLFFIQMSNEKTVEIATEGGTLVEGVLGTPRFVNPVLAVTRADRDMTTLIYDGLMKLGNEGEIVPHIAESVTISDDGLVYNVILKQGVRFHDGVELTARDVVFTVMRIQDPLLNSPLRANFDGVVVEQISDYELNFVLPEAYAPFIENLTFGILPHHIWKDAGAEEFPFSQNNTEAIGAGPYMVDKIIRNASGIPEKFTLRAFEDYHAGTPKIEFLEMRFYPMESRLIDAFKNNMIESVVGLSSEEIEALSLDQGRYTVERIPLPRTFAVFFNQNKLPILREAVVRNALKMVIDKQVLVDIALGGYGNVLHSPIPPGFGVEGNAGPAAPQPMDAARELLRENGWKINPERQVWEKTVDDVTTTLSFSIATINNSAFEKTAEYLRTVWTELGAEVTVRQFELSDLTVAVIRPRDYELLLFGTQLGRSLDYYSFWHSSQRNDPGLNIALYANITTDSILSDLRKSTSTEDREARLISFAEEINNETPAIFLYAPELVYILPKKIKNTSFTGVGEPHERFSSVHEWYIKTESVWPIFTQ